MKELVLDRMAVEEAGTDPRRLAEAIHRQMSPNQGAVPIYEIARALDIVEIREGPLTNFEGALVADPERDIGMILLNRNSPVPRRRYTAAHELLHFLNPLHEPTAENGFECRKEDLALGTGQRLKNLTLHQRQETEANRFAIELLAPPSLMQPFLRGSPDLEHVLRAAAELNLSKQATARRYIELKDAILALVFTKDSIVQFFDWTDGFPFLSVRKGDRAPMLHERPERGGEPLTVLEAADAKSWLRGPTQIELFEQTLFQAEGRAITLLLADRDEDDGLLRPPTL